jgi:GNAT superfamily N-acetyltransferase
MIESWAPSELNGTANAYVSEAALRAMIAGDTPKRAYVIQRDQVIAGAFTARRYRVETNEKIVRIDSVAISDQAAERAFYEWLTNHPQDFNEPNAIDVWLPCSEPGEVAQYGFTHARTYLRLDLASLDDVVTTPLPHDVSIIGPEDEPARMIDWARLYNDTFAGEWRHALIRDIEMRQQVLGAGRHSIAALDEKARTISLVLTQIEQRVRDPLAQPTANIAIVCTDATRSRERIGEGMLRVALDRARSAGARSATIRTDLDSRYESHRLYKRVGFQPANRFCAWSRQL